MPESLPHHSAKNCERLDHILGMRNACLQGGVKKSRLGKKALERYSSLLGRVGTDGAA